MSEARLAPWSLEGFLAWEESQPAKYELVDGQPRPMTGVSQGHYLIVANIAVGLRGRLRGSPCRPHGPELRVITGTGNVRYPDVGIDCGAFEREFHNASLSVAVFEVLSRTTAWIDLHHKLRDYDATPSIQHYIIVAQDGPRVEVWTRGTAGRLGLAATLTTLDAHMTLDPPGVTLAIAELYDGLGFTEPPA